MNETTTVELRIRARHNLWVTLTHDEGTPPTQLLTEFTEAGWTDTPLGPFLGRVEHNLASPAGNGLFGLHDQHQSRGHASNARAILRRHGLNPGRVRTMTLADML